MTVSPPPSTATSTSDTPHQERLRVLIVGGGIGGLMLGLMLERAAIDYIILERSSEIRPLGSAISLNGTVLRVIEQLGLLEDLHKISKFSGRLHLVKEDTTTQGHIDLEHFCESLVLGRPDLLQLLVSRIPPGKLVLGKRVLSTARTEFGVLVRCSDNTAYEGDLLVGADGAYSSIRQNMYKELKDKKMLPRSDSKPLKFDQNVVVGITDELDPEKYPVLKQNFAELHGIIGNKAPYTMWLIPIVGNKFAWSIGGRILDSDVGKEDVRSFSFAEWFPEFATDVCDLVRDFVLPDLSRSYQDDGHYKDRKTDTDMHHHDSDAASLTESSCHSTLSTEESSNASTRGNREIKSEPLIISAQIHLPDNIPGLLPRRQTPTAKPGTVGEIIDATPNDRISKVMLESKLFKTWYHERTVLIGDSCHKILPFAGQGATQAILDCISLANALYDMNTISDDDITKAFKRYTRERFPVTKNAVSGSQSFGKLLNIKGKLSDFVRTITFNKVPHWLLRMVTDKLHLHRPQLTYLPMVPDRGTAKAHVQEYSPKYLAKLVQERQEALAASATRNHHPDHQRYRLTQQHLPKQLNGDQNATTQNIQSETDAHDNNHTNDKYIDRSSSGSSPSVDIIESNEHHDHNDRVTPSERHHGTGRNERKSHSRSRDRRHLELHADNFYEFSPPPTTVPTHHSQHYDFSSVSSSSSSTTIPREARRKTSRAGLVPPPLPTQAPPRHHPAEYLHHHPEDLISALAPLRSSSSRSLHSAAQHYHQHQHPQQHRSSLARRNTAMSNNTTNTAASSIYSSAASSASSSPSSSPAIQHMAAYEPMFSPDLYYSEGYTDNSYSHYQSDSALILSAQQQQHQQQRLPRLPRSPLRSTSNFEVQDSAYTPIQ
ncbi:hypothetical protein FBU30_001027 [Linnemannia zychae]|nr:hypothetical protein FBU30_001027 [Linnemannia zychae]